MAIFGQLILKIEHKQNFFISIFQVHCDGFETVKDIYSRVASRVRDWDHFSLMKNFGTRVFHGHISWKPSHFKTKKTKAVNSWPD